MQKLRLSAALAVAVCGLAVAAGPAAAANLFMGSDNVLQYVDLSNQDNHVTVSNGHPGGLLVQDTFSMNVTPNCTATPSTLNESATCMPTNGRPLQRYSFFLNVGNDALDLRQATLSGDIGNLNGGPGADSIFAGGGDDTINVAGDGTTDSYGCGGGFDIVNADLVDHHGLADLRFVTIGGRLTAVSGCEVVNSAPVGEQPTVALPSSLRVRHGKVAVRVTCPAKHNGGPCSGKLALARVVPGSRSSEHVSKLGSATFHMALSKSQTLHIAVGTASGAVQAAATEHDSQGRLKTTTSQLVLR